jgi:NAD(P)-dependent dehydrogenase (short-subunit alcohol dehydrogenase family)
VAADASDPEGLRATLTSLYAGTGAPGVLVYNASMLTPDSLLSSDVAHLHQAYDVDVAGAIVATQVAAPAMRAAGGGTILFTGGGWADHPGPARGTVARQGRVAAGGGHARCRPGGRFRAVCKAANIGEHWTPRELRHSFVSLMSTSGVPVEEIARLAGHSSTRTTELVYRRELRPVLTTGAEIMDTIFHAQAPG